MEGTREADQCPRADQCPQKRGNPRLRLHVYTKGKWCQHASTRAICERHHASSEVVRCRVQRHYRIQRAALVFSAVSLPREIDGQIRQKTAKKEVSPNSASIHLPRRTATHVYAQAHASIHERAVTLTEKQRYRGTKVHRQTRTEKHNKTGARQGNRETQEQIPTLEAGTRANLHRT